MKALALLAATGLATSVMADVVSVNVVGFVNMNLTNGYNLLVNPLSVTNPAVDTVGAFLPAPPNGTQIIKWNVAGQHFDSAILYDLDLIGGWEDPSLSVNAGEGFFLKLPGNATVTFVGEVRQGNLSTPVITGYSLVGSQVPQGGADIPTGGITTALGFSPINGDQAIKWNTGAQRYDSALLYDLDLIGGWEAEPTLNIGEAVFIKRSGAAGSWTRTFTVQ